MKDMFYKTLLTFLIIFNCTVHYSCSNHDFGYSDPCGIFRIGESKRSIKQKVRIYQDSGDNTAKGNCLDSIECHLFFERKLMGLYLKGFNFGFYPDKIGNEDVSKILRKYNFSQKLNEPTEINGTYTNSDNKVTLHIKIEHSFKRYFYFRVK